MGRPSWTSRQTSGSGGGGLGAHSLNSSIACSPLIGNPGVAGDGRVALVRVDRGGRSAGPEPELAGRGSWNDCAEGQKGASSRLRSRWTRSPSPSARAGSTRLRSPRRPTNEFRPLRREGRRAPRRRAGLEARSWHRRRNGNARAGSWPGGARPMCQSRLGTSVIRLEAASNVDGRRRTRVGVVATKGRCPVASW